MIHRNIFYDDLEKCTKRELTIYIKSLLEEIDLLATCNQDLETRIKRKGKQECQNTTHLTE